MEWIRWLYTFVEDDIPSTELLHIVLVEEDILAGFLRTRFLWMSFKGEEEDKGGWYKEITPYYGDL